MANVGDLRRLTVAVIIDGSYEKTEGAWSFVPRKPEELERVRQLVSNAVGLNAERGDSLEVSSAPFNDSEPPHEPNFAEMLADYAERLGKPLLNALLAFLFLMLVVRPVVLALIRPKVSKDFRAPRNSWPFTRLLKRPTGPTRKKSRPVMKMRSWSSRISKQSRPTSSPFRTITWSRL